MGSKLSGSHSYKLKNNIRLKSKQSKPRSSRVNDYQQYSLNKSRVPQYIGTKPLKQSQPHSSRVKAIS